MALTYGSGSGSRRPKNIRIRGIRIRNTRLDVPELVADLAKQLIVVIRRALLALSHLKAQDLLVDVNLEQQDKVPSIRATSSVINNFVRAKKTLLGYTFEETHWNGFSFLHLFVLKMFTFS